MLRLQWKDGSVSRGDGPVLLSATRFTYRSFTDMPGVLWHGLALRKHWHRIEGAVGVFLAGDLLLRTTYTVSAWRDERALRRWLGSRDHLRLMRRYRSRIQSSSAVTWSASQLHLREIMTEGMARLAERDRVDLDDLRRRGRTDGCAP